MTPSLVIFDIDGTLTDTVEVDDRCFLRALEVALSLDQVSDDWAAYPDVTDAGMVAEALASAMREEEFDLVLTGLQSDDQGFAQTGTFPEFLQGLVRRHQIGRNDPLIHLQAGAQVIEPGVFDPGYQKHRRLVRCQPTASQLFEVSHANQQARG